MGILNVTAGFVLRRRAARPATRRSRTRGAMLARRRATSSTSAANRRGRARTPVDEADELRASLPVVEALAGDGALRVRRHDEARRDARGARRRRVDDQRRARVAGAGRARRRRGERCGRVPDAHAGRAAHDAGARRRTTTSSAKCAAFLRRRARRLRGDAGIARERIVIDPGFGFGKTVAHNLAAVARARRDRGARLSGAGGPVAQVDARRDHRARRRRPACRRASRRRLPRPSRGARDRARARRARNRRCAGGLERDRAMARITQVHDKRINERHRIATAPLFRHRRRCAAASANRRSRPTSS